MDGINGITCGYSLAVLVGLWMANNYVIGFNEGGVSHLKISIGYAVLQILINIMIVVLVGRLSLPYMMMITTGLLFALTIVYIAIKRKFYILKG